MSEFTEDDVNALQSLSMIGDTYGGGSLALAVALYLREMGPKRRADILELSEALPVTRPFFFKQQMEEQA